MSGNRWRFSAVVDDYMQSRYAGDEALCKLRVTSRSVKVEGRLTFLPKDIVLIDVEAPASFIDRFKKSPNQTAIAKVLLAKHLREINQATEKAGVSSIVGWTSVLAGDVKSDD
ncbi:hypothetical protein EAS56_37790 [Bradyrhizobium guangzhouense]|uniref:DUF1488 family protein n=2 Tax=Bradyrhizobium guangzhouense TaxID=1325095 RepID=A0ABY0DUM9_9BRAD|nr:hypothetical protein EAS56_37790 [Bradyrhizobium guangzhouense]